MWTQQIGRNTRNGEVICGDGNTLAFLRILFPIQVILVEVFQYTLICGHLYKQYIFMVE